MFNPCCCCFRRVDSFDRSESSHLGADWTIESGAWSIDGSHAVCDSTNGLAIYDPSAPSAEAYIVNAKFTGIGVGEVVRLVADYDNADNYVSLEFEWINADKYELRLIRRTAGANSVLRRITRLNTAMDNSTDYVVLRLSISEGAIKGLAHNSADSSARSVTGVIITGESFTSKKGGIGTGDVWSGGQVFDWWRIETAGTLPYYSMVFAEQSDGTLDNATCPESFPVCLGGNQASLSVPDMGDFRPCCETFGGNYICDLYAFQDGLRLWRNFLENTECAENVTVTGSDGFSSRMSAGFYNDNLSVPPPFRAAAWFRYWGSGDACEPTDYGEDSTLGFEYQGDVVCFPDERPTLQLL